MKVICHEHVLEVLDALEQSHTGRLWKDIPVRRDGSKRIVLKELKEAGLLIHRGRRKPYQLTKKGRKLLTIVRSIRSLDGN